MDVRLTPTKPATRRTKTRIAQHGPVFAKVKETLHLQCFNGRPAIFVEAKDGWSGWLPSYEIIEEDV